MIFKYYNKLKFLLLKNIQIKKKSINISILSQIKTFSYRQYGIFFSHMLEELFKKILLIKIIQFL